MKKSAIFLLSLLFFFFFSFSPKLFAVTPTPNPQACQGRSGCDPDSKTDECAGLNKPTCGTFYCKDSGGFGVCTEGESNLSASLDVPQNVKSIEAGTGSVTLQWDRVPGAVTYQVIDTRGAILATVNNETKSTISTTIKNLPSNSDITLWVKSCRKGTCSSVGQAGHAQTAGAAKKKNLGEFCNLNLLASESECSVGNCIITPLNIVGVCLDLFGGDSNADLSGITPDIGSTGKTGDSVSLTIKNPNHDIAAYSVYYKKEGDTEWSKPQSFQTNNFTISGLANNTKYVFSAFGYNKKGATKNSNELPVTTSETQGNPASSCSSQDCNGTICSTLNAKAGFKPYCLITSQKGQPLACHCDNPPPAPTPLCNGANLDSTTGLCKQLDTSLGIVIPTTPVGFAKTLYGIVLSLSGGIAILLIIISGYGIMTSRGDPEKIQTAKDTITSTIIGLVFIIFSLIVLQIIGVDILQIPGLTK